MTTANILKHWKRKRHMTTAELSARSGVPTGTINKLLTGETTNPTAQTLRRLAEALEISAQTFLGEDKTVPDRVDMVPISRSRVQLLGEIAAGKPIYADEERELAADADGLKADFALRIHGDSMIGARIHDGDLVFIRKCEDVPDGAIAAVMVDDSATLKRVYHNTHGLTLVSENPKYPPMLILWDKHENVRILGKAIGFQSRLE